MLVWFNSGGCGQVVGPMNLVPDVLIAKCNELWLKRLKRFEWYRNGRWLGKWQSIEIDCMQYSIDQYSWLYWKQCDLNWNWNDSNGTEWWMNWNDFFSKKKNDIQVVWRDDVGGLRAASDGVDGGADGALDDGRSPIDRPRLHLDGDHFNIRSNFKRNHQLHSLLSKLNFVAEEINLISTNQLNIWFLMLADWIDSNSKQFRWLSLILSSWNSNPIWNGSFDAIFTTYSDFNSIQAPCNDINVQMESLTCFEFESQVGTFANALVFAVFYRRPSLRTISNR